MTTAPTSDALADRRVPGLSRWLFAPLRFLASVVAAQSLLGGVVLLGYVYRRMQNHAIAVWTDAPWQPPRWLFAEEASGGRAFVGYTGSLWQHLRMGVFASLSIVVVMVPGSVAMAVSWYSGWNNSFYKGYENATVGPLLGFFGIGLSMLAMTYLPYAQARHALTGDWRMFFRWRQNLELIGMKPIANVLLPVVYAAAGFVVAGARGLLTFAPQVPAFQGLEEDPAEFLGAWFFWWAVPFVVLLFVAKRIGARLYAKSVVKALRLRLVAHGELHDAERFYIRGTIETNTVETGRSMAATLLRVLWPAALWFPLFGLVYVQQFVNYVGAWGWLNHPVLWVPVLAYTP
jgi:hypothetical protein